MIDEKQEAANAAYAYVKHMHVEMQDQLARRSPPFLNEEDFSILCETFERFKLAHVNERNLSKIAKNERLASIQK